MSNKSNSWVKKILVSVWIVGAIGLMVLAVSSNKISPVGKIASISIIFIAFFGPLAIARANNRRSEQESDKASG